MTAPPPKRPRYSKRQVRVHIVGQSRPEYLDIIPSSFTPNIDPPVAKSQNNIPINTNSRSVGQLVDRGAPVSRSLSRKFYPDIPDDRLISILDQGKQRFVRNPPYVTFHATETTCADCGITLVPLAECKYTVLDVDSPAIVIVVDYRCNRCGKVYHYDGYDHALIRHKMCFYSYELLTDALDNLIDGVSCEQYYNRIMDRYFRLGYPVEVVKSWRNSVNIFKEVVYDFIRLTILPEKPCCAGDYIAAHEIETPVEAKLLEQFIHPWSPLTNARGVSRTTSLDGEFFSTSATRRLVLRYSISAADESKRGNRERIRKQCKQCNRCHSGNITPGLTSEEYDQLLCNLSENSQEGTLLPLFAMFEREIDRLHGEDIQEEYQQMGRQREDSEGVGTENDGDDGVNEAVETETETGEEDDKMDEEEDQVDESGKSRKQVSEANCVRYIAPAAIRTFLRCLSSDVAPLHQLVRPMVEHLVRKYIRTKTLSAFECIQLEKYSPVFYQFLLAVRYRNNGSWPDSLTPLVSRILDQSVRPFVGNDVPKDPFYGNFGSAYKEMYTTGCCLPGFPPIRRLKRYQFHGNDKIRESCSKNKSCSTFLMMCMKHNQCLGFALTKHGESSRTLFDLIYTRWPAAPKVICYDDGCDFIKYALSREPHFFKNTLVVIDGLDFDDPMGITSNATFDARRYSEVAEMVRVNCAQKDNNLERIKKCALFLDDIDFMTVMSYVVYRMNICRIERI